MWPWIFYLFLLGLVLGLVHGNLLGLRHWLGLSVDCTWTCTWISTCTWTSTWTCTWICILHVEKKIYVQVKPRDAARPRDVRHPHKSDKSLFVSSPINLATLKRCRRSRVRGLRLAFTWTNKKNLSNFDSLSCTKRFCLNIFFCCPNYFRQMFEQNSLNV